tara:strand:+ start:2137 stop:2463 length:327 start_codon:yes stop_codon:yes gene_type:complete
MAFALIVIFAKWMYEVLHIFLRVIKLSRKPKIHYIKGSRKDFGDDPFFGFAEIKKVKINDVVCYLKGSWSNIYWQKVSDTDFITSIELQILCGGEKENFLNGQNKILN